MVSVAERRKNRRAHNRSKFNQRIHRGDIYDVLQSGGAKAVVLRGDRENEDISATGRVTRSGDIIELGINYDGRPYAISVQRGHFNVPNKLVGLGEGLSRHDKSPISEFERDASGVTYNPNYTLMKNKGVI